MASFVNPQWSIRIHSIVDLSTLVELDQFEDLQYADNWQAPDVFSFTMRSGSKYVEVVKRSDVYVELLRNGIQKCIGIVLKKSFKITQTDNGKNATWTFSGIDLTFLIDSRLAIAAPTLMMDTDTTAIGTVDTIASSTVAQVMRYYVDRNCIHPAEPNRVVPFLQLGTVLRPNRFLSQINDITGMISTEEITVSSSEYMIVITWSVRFTDMYKEISDVAKAGMASWQLRLDESVPAIYFDVLLGADRREYKAVNSPYQSVVFSIETQSVKDLAYDFDASQYLNTIYAGGSGTAATRQILIIPTKYSTRTAVDPDGNTVTIPDVYDWTFNPDLYDVLGPAAINSNALGNSYGRREAFLSVQQMVSAGGMNAAAQQFLSEHNFRQSITFTPSEISSLLPDRDYFAGDLVTVRYDEEHIYGDAAISSIQYDVSAGSYESISLTIGQLPEPIEKIIWDYKTMIAPVLAG